MTNIILYIHYSERFYKVKLLFIQLTEPFSSVQEIQGGSSGKQGDEPIPWPGSSII
jgi:hypothetical protein